MILNFKKQHLVIIICFLSSIYLILASYDQSEANPIKNNDNYCCYFSFSPIWLIILSPLVAIYYYYYYYHYIVQQQSTEKLPIVTNPTAITNMIRNISDLPRFQPIKPYEVCFINRTQPQCILDEIIYLSEKTKQFTIVPHLNSVSHDYIKIQIEFIQDYQTIITFIEYCRDTDRHSIYCNKLQRLFSNIFNPSKTIYTWGNIMELLRPYVIAGLFTRGNIFEAQNNNIQEQFKLWYNGQYPHTLPCHQYLKYDQQDNLLCSCAHRPYKTPSNQWSLPKAIAYTFDEQLTYYFFGVHQCLAISKLAHVINNRWTAQQLNQYNKNKRNSFSY